MNDVILYAIDELMDKLCESEAQHEKLIYGLLKRSRVIWNSIRINGIEYAGATYDEFCKCCEEKRNILFLSDEEFEDYIKAMKLIEVLKETGWK